MDAAKLIESYEAGKTKFPKLSLANAKLDRAELLGIELSGANLRGSTLVFAHLGSEERRVGKECRSRWSPYP